MNRIAPYAKAVAAAVAAILVAVLPETAEWQEVAATLGALAVYFVPNRPVE